MKVFRYSRTRVVASVCANSCSAGSCEALLVERGEHCERCNTCTSRYKRWCDGLEGTGWRSITVAGCCVCCCDCTLIPSSEYDKDLFEEVAERRAWVKQSETNEQRKFANPS